MGRPTDFHIPAKGMHDAPPPSQTRGSYLKFVGRVVSTPLVMIIFGKNYGTSSIHYYRSYVISMVPFLIRVRCRFT